MPKTIALFYDGTWKSGEPVEAQTNVNKLCESINLPSENKHYIQGVGAHWWDLKSDALSGGAFGRGISKKIQEGYKNLVIQYEVGDSIFLFGFSRGAYAARSLSGFIDKVGLFLKDAVLMEGSTVVKEAFEVYSVLDLTKQKKLLENLQKKYPQHAHSLGFDLLNDVEANRDKLLPIYFIGVWDTVGSLGIPVTGLRWLTEWAVRFHNTELPRNVTHARHAIALHERRATFEPTLWTKTPWRDVYQWRIPFDKKQTLVQVWFPGAHSDVGGGYGDEKSGLSNVTLSWMAHEAHAQGLPIDFTKINLRKPTTIKLHQENTLPYSGPRKAISQNYQPPREQWSNKDEMDSFWNTIQFHESSLKWILDSLLDALKYECIEYEEYEFIDHANIRLKIVDEAAYKLIKWLLRRRIDEAMKNNDSFEILNLLKIALEIKILQLSYSNQSTSFLAISEYLDTTISEIIDFYFKLSKTSIDDFDFEKVNNIHKEASILINLLVEAKQGVSAINKPCLEGWIKKLNELKNLCLYRKPEGSCSVILDEKGVTINGIFLPYRKEIDVAKD